MANITGWDFRNTHVDPTALVEGSSDTGARGNYISSESILLAAGPASAKDAVAIFDTLVPIGVCDTVQVLQNKGVIQLYEIGSRVPYILPGRPIIQIQISRVLFNGDSLLGALTKVNQETAEDFGANVIGKPGIDFNLVEGGDTTGAFYLNLASHYFNQPTGLAMFFKDSEAQWVASFYAENCIIQNHSMAIQGQNMVVMENAAIRCTSFVPLDSNLS